MPKQETPQAIADSLLADTTADSLAVDTVAADTADALGNFSREVGQAGRALAEGDFNLFWETLYQSAAVLLANFVGNLIPALFVLIVFYVLYRALDTVLYRFLDRSRRVDAGLQNLISKTYRVVALTFVGVMVLAQFGVNVTALIAGLSIVGIAVGFAARDSLENFISGITILLDKPFRIGDNVEVDGTFGTVEEITLRSTRLRTLNNQIMVMPNIQMVNQKLLNHTILGLVRIEVPFGIAYKEYPSEARDVVLKLTQGDDRLHPDYPPRVVVTGLNDSSVDLSLRLYLRNPKLEIPVRFEYIEKVREALREADIEIPFPHLQLFVDEAKAFENSRLLAPPPDGASPEA